MFFFEITETPGEIEMRGVVHCLIFEQQEGILIDREVDRSKGFIVQWHGQVYTRHAGAKFGMYGI